MIRAIVRKGVGEYGHEFVGYRDGWRGPLERDSRPLGVPEVRGILPRGGTILGSSRTNPFKEDGGAETDRREPRGRRRRRPDRDRRRGHARRGVAGCTSAGVNVVGVPKTIDNDLSATDYTFGFDTAVNIAMSAIDRLHTTAESHKRTLICEVMGRHAGWIAFHAGLSGGANVILIPEIEFDLDRVCDYIVRRFESQYSPIVVVAEGAQPKGGMPVGRRRADRRLRARPAGRDRQLAGGRDRAAAPATRPGRRCSATSSGAARRPPSTGCSRPASACTRSTRRTTGQWGKMTALRSTDIELVDLSRGDRRAEDGPRVALSRGRGLLRLETVTRPALAALLLVSSPLTGCGIAGSREDRGAGRGLRQPAADGAARSGRPRRRGRRPARAGAGSGQGGLDPGPGALPRRREGKALGPGRRRRQRPARRSRTHTTAAYIGELDSEPTRASVPITNEAGIVQVSPGAGAVDLTAPGRRLPGFAGPLSALRHVSFARTVPSDDVVVDAAASLGVGAGGDRRPRSPRTARLSRIWPRPSSGRQRPITGSR